MANSARSLPARPSLRHLKLEAKRRLAAGEFPALHAAQLAIAREHGQPSWAALKKLIDGQPGQESHVLPHLRWAASRFRGAGAPGWLPPDADELRQHFTDELLRRIPPGELIAAITEVAASTHHAHVVTGIPLAAQVRCAGLQLVMMVEADPPHRVTRARRFPLGSRIVGGPGPVPATHARGEVPAAAREMAAEAAAELGLPGLILAGCGPDAPEWAIAAGWADLERGEVLTAGHRFPACRVTRLITATAVLRLVADGKVRLDDAVNPHFRPPALAGHAVTVTDLLAQTGKAADSGYEALGQLIADVTQSRYADAVTRLVLEPLGMTGSSFPSWAGTGPDAVTGYQVRHDIAFTPVPMASAIPAADGMWTTATDLARFGATWPSLLPEELAREALRPRRATGPGGLRAGLGWFTGQRGDIAGVAGGCPGAFASLLIRVDERSRYPMSRVVLTNRQLPTLGLNLRLLLASGATGSPARWRASARKAEERPDVLHVTRQAAASS
jgi:CubicO group peptidase (beta-lactamase class C family)